MQRVPAVRTTPLALAVVAAALALSAGALFQAPSRGADLAPVAGAETLVRVIQGNQSILWTSLTGHVTSYVVQGWPSSTGDMELGGAMMMERPTSAEAGVIDFGEKPMTLRFEIAR